MKEILLYTSIYEWTAERAIKDIEAAGAGGVVLRVNSRGGNVLDAWGIIAKLAEYKGTKQVKVDGKAYSMAAMMLCYADEVECLDVSEIMFHRAAYPEWIEADSRYMTAAMWQDLKRTNDNLRAAMEAKINVQRFTEITGVSLDDLFNTDTRIDVTLTAQQAKEIGLVNKINKITPELQAFVEEKTSDAIAAMAAGSKIAPDPAPQATTPPATTTTQKLNTMTIEQLKTQHPEAYAAAVQAGVTQERDRTAEWLEFFDIDLAAVKTGIESGEGMSRKDYAAFTRKGIEQQALKGIEESNPAEVPTGEPEAQKTAEAAAIEASMDNVDKMLKIGKYAEKK